jgi:hypothetical protein
MRNVSGKIAEKIKTRVILNNFFRYLPLYETTWKNMYSRTGHKWQYNVAHAFCVLDKYGYRHTLRICKYLLLFHGNNGYVNAPLCYICTHIVCLLLPTFRLVVGRRSLAIVLPSLTVHNRREPRRCASWHVWLQERTAGWSSASSWMWRFVV